MPHASSSQVFHRVFTAQRTPGIDFCLSLDESEAKTCAMAVAPIKTNTVSIPDADKPGDAYRPATTCAGRAAVDP